MSKPESTTSQDVEMLDSAEAGHLKEVQKAINAVRKADSKLRKVGELQKHREAQWEAFQAELKQNFVTQKAAYRSDVAALVKEEQELASNKEDNVKLLKMCINGEARGEARSAAPAHAAATLEDAQQWEALMASTDSPSQQEEAAVDGWLQELLAASHRGGHNQHTKTKLNAC